MTSIAPPIRKNRREVSSHTYERSRSTSVPHVSPAMRAHDLPSRGLGGWPSPTRATTATIVTSSTMATARMASSMRPMSTATVTATKPVTLPTICIIPTIALARPTCLSGMRSGT